MSSKCWDLALQPGPIPRVQRCPCSQPTFQLVLPNLNTTYGRLRRTYILIWGFSSHELKRISRGLWSGRKNQINRHQLGFSRAEKGGNCWLVSQQQPQSPGCPRPLAGSNVIPWGQRSSYSQPCPVQAGTSPPSLLEGTKSGAKKRGEEVML